jgi:hypothetical protein
MLGVNISKFGVGGEEEEERGRGRWRLDCISTCLKKKDYLSFQNYVIRFR